MSQLDRLWRAQSKDSSNSTLKVFLLFRRFKSTFFYILRCGNDMYCFEGRCIHKSIEEINRFRREHAGISQQEVILKKKTMQAFRQKYLMLGHLHWQVVTIPAPKPEAKAHWSEWSSWSSCESSCIVGAKGAQVINELLHCLLRLYMLLKILHCSTADGLALCQMMPVTVTPTAAVSSQRQKFVTSNAGACA